jgi:transcriptional regulator with XRE-family HTH domain
MNKIKECRNLQNLTLRQLSEKAQVAISYISTIENDSEGDKNPSKDVMEKIAKALNSTVPKIFY